MGRSKSSVTLACHLRERHLAAKRLRHFLLLPLRPEHRHLGRDESSEGRQDDGVHERVDAAVELHQAPPDPAERQCPGRQEADVPIDQDVELPLRQVGDVGDDDEKHDAAGQPVSIAFSKSRQG